MKTEIVDQAALLLKGMCGAKHAKIIDALSTMIACVYILGRRLGLNYSSLDQAVLEKVKKHKEEGHQLEEWWESFRSGRTYS